MANMIRFWLNGCDISFLAEAPEDMTVKQLVEQASRIKPDWCGCGIRKLDVDEQEYKTEIFFTYNDVWKAHDDVNCEIDDD